MSVNPKLPIVATLVTFTLVVIMFALGYWQLQRAEFKEQRLTQIEQKKQSAPFKLKSILAMDKNQEIRDLPLLASGHLLQGHYFLRDNSIHRGQVGYEMLAPLVTDSGLLLVNFGWVAATAYREQKPLVALPEGVIQLGGVVSLPNLNPMVTETAVTDDKWPKLIQQVDLEIMSQLLNKPVLPLVLLLSDPSGFGFISNWQAVVMPPEKHLAYAVQWFGLGIAALLVFGFRIRTRIIRNRDE